MEINTEIKDKAIEAIALDKYSSDSTKYIEFAYFLIDHKIETENIYILAGLQNNSYYEKVHYFNKVLEDIKIEIQPIDNLDKIYALSIAKQVIRKELDPIIAVNKLERLYVQTDYNPFYIEFLEISDGIDLLDEDYEHIPGMNKDNQKEYIIHAFELFVIFSELIVPDGFWRRGYCKNCNQRVIPKQTDKKNGIFKKKSTMLCCPYCGSQHFFWTRYNEGKDLYLREIRLTIASTT